MSATDSLGSGAAVAAALASTLDDQSLKTLAETPAGRELLDVLRKAAPDQVDRIRDALNSEPRGSTRWLDNFADQVVHAQVLEAVSFARASAK